MKKILIGIIIFLLILFMFIFLFRTEISLFRKGYTFDEINIIKNKVDKIDIKLLTKTYLKNIDKLLNNKEYKKNNFSKYINYYKKK
jgi:hypothetical protein